MGMKTVVVERVISKYLHNIIFSIYDKEDYNDSCFDSSSSHSIHCADSCKIIR